MKKVYLLFFLSLSLLCAFAQTTITYTATGTWLCPAGVTAVQVEAWGGGGGGGGTALNPSVGGGGAGGTYAISTVSVVPGTSYTVTVGSGGTAGSTSGGAGGTGGSSWFNTNTTILAVGGAGGAGGVSGTPSGAGATGSVTGVIGTTFFAGGNGAAGLVSSYSGAGGGGAGSTAAGGNATTSTAGAGGVSGGGAGAAGRTTGNAGQTGTAPGGGGSGGFRSSGTTRAGGTGGAGKIILTFTCPGVGVPYTENFDGVTAPAIPGCTTVQDVNADGTTWATTTTTPSSSPNALKYGFSFSNAANDWWFTPGLNLTVGTTYKITFKYRIVSTSFPESMELKAGTSPAAAGMGASVLWSVTNDNTNVAYKTITTYFTATAAVQYFGWHANSAANEDGILLDDINIATLPDDDAGITGVASFCAGTQNVTVTLQNFGNHTLTAATINWTVNGVAQPAFNWTGSLATNATASVVVGTYTFAAATNYTIAAASSLPNGVADGNTANDTYTSGTLQSSLSGTYTVGAGGNFTTLTAAVAAANANGLCGPAIFSLTDAAYSAGETFPIIINSLAGSSSTNILTIKPATGVTAAITGSNAADLLQLNGADYIIIDGSNTTGGTSKDLTVKNTSTSTSANVIWINSVNSTNGATNNTIQNCIISGNSATTTSAGIIVSGSTVGNAAETGNNNTLISNNTISACQSAISLIGTSTNDNGNIVRDNLLGSTVAASKIGFIGMQVVNQANCIINGNTIKGLTTTATTYPGAAIDAFGTLQNVAITNNIISDIKNTNSGGYGVAGILLEASNTGANVNVANNFVFDVAAVGFTGRTEVDNGYGIGIILGSGYTIYHNTVLLNTAQTSSGYPSALLVTSGVTAANAIDVRNNIFANTETVTGQRYTIMSTAAKTVFSNIDYNDYYSVGANLGYIGSDRATLANLVTGFGGNANSLNVQPSFVSATDLHLTAANNCGLDGYGTPIAAVTTDIDVQTRDAAAPDMGADEFTATYSTSLAAIAYGTTVYVTKNVSASGTTYVSPACELIAKVVPSGAAPVSGAIKASVTRDPSATNLFYNAGPYLTRHYDIEPAVNAATATATLTMYFTDQEFSDYNTNNPLWPPFPTVAGGGNGDANIANVQVTQYHGTPTTTPSGPGSYSTGSTGVIITPVTVFYNGTNWEVTVPVTGFSGFYVYTAYYIAPLPVTLNYLKGIRQGSTHNLNWSVTCNSTPSVVLTLERSANGVDFMAINTITASALRCGQPFDYADVSPLNGLNYYRLKMADANGKVTYSNIITLMNAGKGSEIVNVSPNPTYNGHFKLNISSAQQAKMEIVITDMQGRAVSRQMVTLATGLNSINMNVVKLAPGVYQLFGNDANGRTKTISFIRQ